MYYILVGKNGNFPRKIIISWFSRKYKKFGKLPTLVHQPTSLYMHIKMRRKEKGTRILKVTILQPPTRGLCVTKVLLIRLWMRILNRILENQKILPLFLLLVKEKPKRKKVLIISLSLSSLSTFHLVYSINKMLSFLGS